MNELRFTKEHKKKLLKMCRYLNKDYIVIMHKSKPGYIFFMKILDTHSIHWFELCSMHLIFDLVMLRCNGITDDCRWEALTDDYCTAVFKDAKHPIDFLYEYFLKNKK